MTKEALQRIKDRVRLPVIMAPMFLIANPNTVLEACKQGIIGSFPLLNARTVEILDEWLSFLNTEVEKLEAVGEKPAPWAVNFIAHRAHNKRYEEDLKMIEKHQPPIVITSLGDPSPIKKIVGAYGGLVFSDVIDSKFAKKAIEKGTDGLILITNGAGGHGGTLNPFAFIQEVKSFWDGPIILGGTISTGQDILAAEVLGADFTYMGTRFIAAKEMAASQEYKEMLVESNSSDIVYTPAFSGISANYLKPSVLKAGIDPQALLKEPKPNLAELMDANVKAWKDIWSAGQGVGAVKEIQSIREIVDELDEQYKRALQLVREKESNRV
ncbi:NAD(P)H-dependent flavin oxidoreductase [Ornithinibacillus californiensis]|uniref:NAD(P)H-dependent flavin oxidoreductase n=1 Tax=Ornithinibacillus californiensis TaxID=161536 RepID=UPI00064DEB0A|nr:nitronate monooxygenase [Ornithinibacillus californiensis]